MYLESAIKNIKFYLYIYRNRNCIQKNKEFCPETPE